MEGRAAAAAARVEEDVDGAAIMATERARLGEVGRAPQGREADGTAAESTEEASCRRLDESEARNATLPFPDELSI